MLPPPRPPGSSHSAEAPPAGTLWALLTLPVGPLQGTGHCTWAPAERHSRGNQAGAIRFPRLLQSAPGGPHSTAVEASGHFSRAALQSHRMMDLEGPPGPPPPTPAHSRGFTTASPTAPKGPRATICLGLQNPHCCQTAVQPLLILS